MQKALKRLFTIPKIPARRGLAACVFLRLAQYLFKQ